MPDLVEAAVPTLWVLCSSYLFQCAGFIFFQSVSGTGDTRSAFLLGLSYNGQTLKDPLSKTRFQSFVTLNIGYEF